MPDWLNAILLGLVEGLTEFIPVSSTGHLILAKDLLGLSGPTWDTFIVLIQLGAILAVVALYFQKLLGVLLGLGSSPEARRFALSVLIAFIPAVVLGVALHDVIKTIFFESPTLICWSLIVGGVALLVIDRFPPKPVQHDAMKFPLLMSLGVGVCQCLSLIPGVSRSGATIVGGMLLGADKRAAAEFSFFLAIPTMAGAFAFDLLKSYKDLDMSAAGLIAIGFVVSFVSGLIVIKTMLGFVAKRGYGVFGWWRILVGGAGLLLIKRFAA
jgi:undecaprenyl-diphosphatase